MKNEKSFISIIIPIEKETKYLKESLFSFSQQTYSNFEVLVVSSVPIFSSYSFVINIVNKKLVGDVASKRNQILKHGKGELFVFNDDDVFVPKNYLKNIIRKFRDSEIIAACGPLLTPPADSFWQQGSGAVFESYLGSLGAGIYRNRLYSSRIVDDYPAANLIVRKKIFQEIGGFEKKLYPGEDTKFCLLMINKYQRGVNYDPNLCVYHHRKSLFKEHLNQIGRYGCQRGWFALSYPSTSFKIYYFFPSVFLLYLFFLPLTFVSKFYLTPLIIYGFLLMIDGYILLKTKNIKIVILAIIGIVTTHLYYGYRFLRSFINKILEKTKNYL